MMKAKCIKQPPFGDAVGSYKIGDIYKCEATRKADGGRYLVRVWPVENATTVVDIFSDSSFRKYFQQLEQRRAHRAESV